MLKKRKDIFTVIFIALHFILILWARLSFDFTVDPEISNEYNDFWFNVEAIGKFDFVFAFFYYSKGWTKVALRILMMAYLFDTLNELIGLNAHLDSIQFPVFWAMIIVTGIYSILKHKPE